MSANWRSSLAGPITSHPMYEDNAYLASRRPVPRVRDEGILNAELQRGCMDLLFKMQALTTGGSVLDKPHYRRKPALKASETVPSSTSSSDSESPARPPTRRGAERPSTPGHSLSTSRTSRINVRPSSSAGSPPQSDAQAIASLDSDIRLIRSELESLRHRVHSDYDDGYRPRTSRDRRQHRRREDDEEMEDERTVPRDWVERTRRRREVEEEVTYKRANGERETYRWRRRSGDSPERSVRFETPSRFSPHGAKDEDSMMLRSREKELAMLRAREKELVAHRAKEEEKLAALKAQHKSQLIREEWKKRAVQAKEKEEANDPDCPEGYRKVPDEERRAMLELMMQAEKEVRQRIARLPVILDTYRSRQRKQELEAALDELQGAIAVYAQRKVFIQANK